MAKVKEREFGKMPEWAKKGPITLKNYPYRAEQCCAYRSAERGGEHPTIKRPSSEFSLWRQYFEVHLGGLPVSMERLLLAEPNQAEMTVPEGEPQWFDPTFTPDPAWQEREYLQIGSRPRWREPIPDGRDYYAMVRKHGRPLQPGEIPSAATRSP